MSVQRRALVLGIISLLASAVPAQLITDPNHPGVWQGATIGTFATLLYGADTPANRQLLVTNLVLDEGIFDPTGFVAGTLVATAWASGYGGCSGQSFDTTGTGSYGYTCSAGLSVFQCADGIDEFWFQSSGVIGDTVFDLGGPVQKAVVFNTIDHGPLPQEAIESTVYLSNDQVNWTQAVVERVWLNGFHSNFGVLWDGFVFTVKTGTGSTFRYASVIHGGPGALISDGDDEINGIMGFQDVLPPFIDLQAVPGSIAIAPSNPQVGQMTTVTAQVKNAGNTTAMVAVSLYLGDPDLGGILLDTQLGTIGYGTTAPFSLAWVPTNPGPQSLFVVATNQTVNYVDANPLNDRTSSVVIVDAPLLEITLGGGEIVAWPGASFDGTVVITNTGTTAATLDSFVASSPWATIPVSPVGSTVQPGEQLSVLIEVTVPIGTAGGPVGGVPVPYGVGLDATAGAAFDSATLLVKVFDQPLTPVTISVVDDLSSAALAGALVSIEGVPGTFVTDAVGEVTTNLPDGARGFFAYQTGYVAAAVSAEVGPGSTTVEIRLQPGQTLEIQQIVTQQLSTAEILARGINVMDPVNNVVVDFIVYLQIGGFPLVLPNIEIPALPSTGTSFSFGGTAISTSGQVFTMGATFVETSNGQQQTWIVIPGSAMALKQFFEVTAYVVNNAAAPIPTDVQIQNALISLNLPAGLGLPDLNGMPQALTQVLGTLDAGESVQATWVVRGDLPGSYQLTGQASGDLYAFGNFVQTLTASAISEPFAVVLPELRLEFQTPSTVVAGVPFTFGVQVTNESIAVAQYVRVSLKVENLVHCALAATQPMNTTLYFDPFANVTRAEVTLGDIDPGHSGLAQFDLIPDVSGVVTNVIIETWSSTQPTPGVSIGPAYPGLGDVALASGLTAVDADSLHVGSPNQLAIAHVSSPGGTLVGLPFWYAIGLYSIGQLPSESPSGIWIGNSQLLFAFPNAPITPTGRTISATIPASLAGFSLVAQAIVIDPLAPGGYAASDAHELIVTP